MELGRGSAVPLGVWARVANDVRIDLRAVPQAGNGEEPNRVQLQAHRMVVALAAVGGWLGWTLAEGHDARATTTFLERRERGEVAIVMVWDVVTDAGSAMHALEAAIDGERALRGSDQRVSGAVVVTATGPNRRRFTESASLIRTRLTARGDAWVMSLGRVHVPMPNEIGMIWTDPGLTRLRPYIPYVDCRPRCRIRPR